MIRNSAPLRIAFACALVLSLEACASSGYERASDTADRTVTYRDDLVRLRAQVGLVTEALRALSENPGDSPRTNKETFETFALELESLERAAERSRTTYGHMDGRAERFFGGWNEDTAEITNAELKQSAAARRNALQANYVKLARGQLEVDQGLARFVRGLDELRLYLENDLTAAGIASARSTITQTLAQGAALRAQLEGQSDLSVAAQVSLAPLRQLAPSKAARTKSDGRVR